MKIKSLKIKDFRGYSGETSINFDDFTAFVGKNDIGKSSIMEALDIFFNDGKGVIKLDREDVNIGARTNRENEISISVCFSDFSFEKKSFIFLSFFVLQNFVCLINSNTDCPVL